MSSLRSEVRVFAPATVANLGPGFDVLGLALAQPGDTVTARRVSEPGVRIIGIRGDGGRLPLEAAENTAGIAAAEVLAQAGARDGLELELEKGLPLFSGLGSSAASAAAGALAANLLLGSPLDEMRLVACGLVAEEAVSGRHADNIAAALLGGLILIRSTETLDVVRLPAVRGLSVVVVTPELEVPTRQARDVLPKRVKREAAVEQAANLGAMITAIHSGDTELLGRAMVDRIATPARAELIPSCLEVFAAARDAGALGAEISGAGPSVFALCDSESTAAIVGKAMQSQFKVAGFSARTVISPTDCEGARQL
jgi:homoserine kinase